MVYEIRRKGARKPLCHTLQDLLRFQCNSVHVIASATHPITIHIIYIRQRTLDYPELHNWAVSSSADGCLTTTNRKVVPDVIAQLIAGYLHSLLGTHVDLEISVPFGFSYVISCLGDTPGSSDRRCCPASCPVRGSKGWLGTV